MERLGLSATHFKHDFRVSIVVFLVALPLAMGVAVASGYPPAAGLITGIIGGIVVGMLSGAPLQVSGAAAGLTVLVYHGVSEFGMDGMAVAIVLAGLFQLVAAALRLGRWFQAVSPTVLHAMLAGIGILIVAGQFHVMFDRKPIGTGLDNIAAAPAAFTSALASGNTASLIAFGLGLLSVALMLFWPRLAKGKWKILPPPLVAVLGCAAAAWVGGFSVNFVEIPASLFSSSNLGLPGLGLLVERPALVGYAMELALIASAESLLCAAAVDQMHMGPRAKFNKELAAQGVGNALCGLLGAIPMTGVIVRSSANVAAGATTRTSAVLHGVWLLLFASLLPAVLSYIPIAALAGILVFIGVKLVNVKEIKRISSHGRSEIVIYGATVAVIVSFDLLLGVLLGLAMSGLKLLRQLSHLSVSVQEDLSTNNVVVNLGGAATFLRLPKLVGALERVPPGTTVEIRSSLRLMDPACSDHFEQWKTRHQRNGGEIRV